MLIVKPVTVAQIAQVQPFAVTINIFILVRHTDDGRRVGRNMLVNINI